MVLDSVTSSGREPSMSLMDGSAPAFSRSSTMSANSHADAAERHIREVEQQNLGMQQTRGPTGGNKFTQTFMYFPKIEKKVPVNQEMIIDHLLIFSASLVYLFKVYLWQLIAKITFSLFKIKIVNIYANYFKKGAGRLLHLAGDQGRQIRIW